MDGKGGARPVVLGRTLWGDRFQRNIVFDLKVADSRFWSIGLPGDRKAFAEQARGRYGRLELFPIVLRAQADDAVSYRVAMAAVRELAIRSPERLTGGQWQLILRKEPFAPLPQDLPDSSAWFRPALPPGTSLDVDARLVMPELVTIRPEELAALRAEAPYDAELAVFAAPRRPVVGTSSVAELAAFYGPLADFHVRMMGRLADAAWYEPAEFRRRQGALCELSAERCLLLGYRLAELGFADEAAEAYQKGFDGSRDRVRAANESRWLVDYYFDHGKKEKAESVARAAADVYSGGGLFVMARLMERMGRQREAEEYYRRIHERYNQSAELVGFYYRRSRIAKDASYEPRLRDALALALPPGLEPFDRASLPPSPRDGAVFKGANDNTKRFGIAWGNVVVAVDGFRVHDYSSYDVLRALSQSPRMRLVIWRGKSYDEVEVELWDRRFRVDIEDYKPVG
jgi:tetratricopeptide (TPR) repeat protein